MAKGSRGYDDGDVKRILERAALVPLEEIRSIAREAGMDPAAVDVAARSLGDDAVSERWPIIGRAPRMEATTSVSGVLDEEGRQHLLGLLQRALDAKGRARETPGTLEWRRWGILGRELVVVTARRGQTQIEVRGRYRRGMAASYLTGGLAGGLAAAGLLELAHLTHLLGDWIAPVVMASALGGGRVVWEWFSGLKERALRKLAKRAAAVVADSADGER